MVYRYIISINVIPWRVNVVANTNFTIPSGYRHVEFLNERPSDMALFYRKLTEVIIARVGCDRTYADGQSEEVSLGADGQSEEVSPDAGNQSKEVSSDFETTAGQQSLQLSLHPIEFCFSGDMVYLPRNRESTLYLRTEKRHAPCSVRQPAGKQRLGSSLEVDP